MMAIESRFWLLLLSMFGIRCDTDIKISTKNELLENEIFTRRYLSLYLVYGNKSNGLTPMAFPNSKSSFACVTKELSSHIDFHIDEKSASKKLNLNIATDSEEFKSYPNSENTIKWKKDTKVLCFLLGTWWPKESGDVELYLNFLSTVTSDKGVDLVFVSSDVTKDLISSQILINNNQLIEKTDGAEDRFELKKKELSNAFATQKTPPENENRKAISSEGHRSDQKVIGTLDCPRKDALEVQFK